MNNIITGNSSEEYVLRRYKGEDWTCLLRNYQFHKKAELDFVFIKRRTIRFVEVRTLSFKFHPYQSVTPSKRNKIRYMASMLLANMPQYSEFKKEIFLEIVDTEKFKSNRSISLLN